MDTSLSFTPSKIYYVTPFLQDEMKQFKEKGVQFYHSWAHPDLKLSQLKKEKYLMLIIDDFAYSDQLVEKQLIRWSVLHLIHHLSWLFILITHSLFSKSLDYHREISLNISVFVCPVSRRGYSMIEFFARQLADGKRLKEAYADLANDNSQSYAHVIIDCRKSVPSKYSIRSNITKEYGPCIIYYPKNLLTY